MKKLFQLKTIAGFAVALLISTAASAQMGGGKTIASPRDSVSGKIGGATISINYGSPSVKGRKILGAIEPYGKPWRAGANAATTFTTDKDLTIQGKKLPAGKYTIFMTPGETEWKVMFNSALGEWGIKKDASDSRGYSANDDPAKDVLVITVKPKTVAMTERLKYEINSKGFELVWETTSVPVSIK
ncbi:MAG: hypothetical protein JWQ79_3495 [Mucilaginibacter sp.]|nr:hypothetical protein [Mucilaginibacter sp.]